MWTVVGIFTSQAAAERGTECLRVLDIAPDRIILLALEADEEQLQQVPTTETEPLGVGTSRRREH